MQREVDLIEEVARLHGFDRIPSLRPRIGPTNDVGTREPLVRRVRSEAVSLGLSEALTYGFVSPAKLKAVFAPEASVVLANPLQENHSVMRTSLLPGLLDSAVHARRHGERSVRYFTLGSVFLESKTPLPHEVPRIAFLLAGERPSFLERHAPYDAWDIKGLVVAFVDRMLHKVPRIEAGEQLAHLHPRAAAIIFVGDESVGTAGLLHPDVADAFDLGADVWVAEIDLSAFDLEAALRVRYAPIPRFPASSRDLSVVVSEATRAGDVGVAIMEAARGLAERVEVFDLFKGGALSQGQVSLAFHVVYRAGDRTLTDAEVDTQHAQVVSKVSERFGASLRA